MAFSATTRPNFSFHLLTSKTQNPTSPSKPKTLLYPKNPFFLKPPRPHFISASVDVSKDNKPISEKPQSPPPPPEDDSFPSPSEEEPKLDRRRLEERFAVLNTGIYECRSCGYLYDEAAGDPSYPIPPGLQSGKLPEDWRCPTCGAAQSFFVSKSVEIAGFAQNQQFGLGGNALTSGQKAVLIYGKWSKDNLGSDYDVHPETVFQATFGNRCFTWYFRSREDSKFQNSTYGFEWRENSDQTDNRRVWETSESDNDEATSIGLYSDRVTLGLPPTGPLKIEDVKNAFRASALKWHPDKHLGPSKIIYGANRQGIIYAWDLRGGRTSVAFQSVKELKGIAFFNN